MTVLPVLAAVSVVIPAVPPISSSAFTACVSDDEPLRAVLTVRPPAIMLLVTPILAVRVGIVVALPPIA